MPNHPPSTSDAQLWDRFRAGDEAAYVAIYQRYVRVLYNYGLRVMPQQSERVLDAIQDLFVYLWQRRAHLGPTASIRNYLFKALRRKLRRQFRQPFSFAFYEALTQAHDRVLSLADDFDRAADQLEEEHLHQLTTALEHLPDSQKEIIYLRFYNQMSAAEIADILAVSTRTVYRLLDRALEELQNNIVLELLVLLTVLQA
ncbi:RNA polymerase sigma-70 factor, ECF subfamily [Catalinimonas alkaloidigena]|uniref:RNA polymerase sigma-70 factor, ECF subfamily n=1 Tax=Catalinimonas alkaloidigena TaxID=1075417 RepID=A0A1G9PED2_9BACT|nr:sigma-70 family RNA polymerase sigma factor [Catalinimonas alkaloidigena]SDL96831.1 RNA polymerase sigma-70 factor, ECF subfamily [Catalinimonas alkaloidigena]